MIKEYSERLYRSNCNEPGGILPGNKCARRGLAHNIKKLNNVVVQEARNMKIGKYIAIVIALVMIATTITVVAEDVKIGNIAGHTNAESIYDGMYISLLQDLRQLLEIKYNNELQDATITNFKLRILRARGGDIYPDWFELYINGENAGNATRYVHFEATGTDEAGGETNYYLEWDNINMEVNGTVVFEIYKPEGRGVTSSFSAATYFYGRINGTDENAVAVAGADDGLILNTKYDRDRHESPNGTWDGPIASRFWKLGYGKAFSAGAIYEFTYTTSPLPLPPEPEPEPESEPEPEPEPEPQPPQTPQPEPDPVETNNPPTIALLSPVNGATGINISEPIQLIAEIYDEEGDIMDVKFLDYDTNQLLGQTEITGSQLVSISVGEDYFDYNTTYRWRVRVTEKRNGGHQVTSSIFSFTTMEQPVIPEIIPDPETEPDPEEGTVTDEDESFFGIYILPPLIFIIAIILVLIAVKYFGNRKKKGKKINVRSKIGYIKRKLGIFWIKLSISKWKPYIVGIVLYAITIGILLWLKTSIVTSIAVIAVLTIVLFLLKGKGLYRKIRALKDRLLLRLVSKDAINKRTTVKVSKKSKA